MRRRDLTHEELEKVIRLKQIGNSWLKIQHETGINRRIAKRAYDKWERSKSMDELKEARKDVAAAEFREHMNSLIKLAMSLVTNLSVPSFLTDMENNTEQFFSWLWQQDLLQRHIPLGTQEHVYTMGDTQCFYKGDSQVYRREQQLLFESLKVHTREEVPWDDVLDNRWKKAKNNCTEIVLKLRKQTSEVVNNFLRLEWEPNLLQSITDASREDDPAKRMAQAVLGEIWRAILQDKLDEEGLWFETVLLGKGTPQEINVKAGDERIFTFFGDTNMGLAEKVTRICNWAVDKLCKDDMVQKLYREVGNMKKASEELREMLNPVKLRPMILRTRCDLCPA